MLTTAALWDERRRVQESCLSAQQDDRVLFRSSPETHWYCNQYCIGFRKGFLNGLGYFGKRERQLYLTELEVMLEFRFSAIILEV